jgi:hypothetical protein
LDALLHALSFSDGLIELISHGTDVPLDLGIEDGIEAIQALVNLSQYGIVPRGTLGHLFVNKGTCKGLQGLELLGDVLIKQLLVGVDQVEDLLEPDILHLAIILKEREKVGLERHPHIIHGFSQCKLV